MMTQQLRQPHHVSYQPMLAWVQAMLLDMARRQTMLARGFTLTVRAVRIPRLKGLVLLLVLVVLVPWEGGGSGLRLRR